MNNQNNDFIDDDIDHIFRFNLLHKDIAKHAATEYLKESMNELSQVPDLPQSDLLIFCHAFMTGILYENGHPNGFQRSVLGLLERLVEKVADISESIDCSVANPTEFWMQSDLAAIDKAKELDINILPEYSMADLRYKIYCAINEVI